MHDLSIVVTFGYVGQTEIEHKERGDEVDHLAPLNSASSDFELIIVDRDWPNRWDKLSSVLAPIMRKGLVKYIPSKPSEMINHGYRACCAMRNSGAIVSNGNVLAFVDDHILLLHDSTDAVCSHFKNTGRVLCPVITTDIDSRTPDGAPSDFGGHNGGIYMCLREDFVALNGFDENFDGAYGEEDTEFQDRLDRRLYLTGAKYRQRQKGVLWPNSYHANGMFPEQRRPFWVADDDGGYVRCNKSYAHGICYKRIHANSIRGNLQLNECDLVTLKEHHCDPGCGICGRADREYQIASYLNIKIDERVSEKMKSEEFLQVNGLANPWS